MSGHRRTRSSTRAVLPAVLLATACVSAPPRPATDEVVAPAEGYADLASLPELGSAPAEVCRELGDDDLGALQVELASSNLDLRAALARIEAAEGRAREAGAALLPRIDASLQATRSNSTFIGGTGFGGTGGLPAGALDGDPQSGDDTPPTSGSGEITLWQPSVAASWEVDLWGKARARKRAARLDTLATDDDRRALGVALSARLAETWFALAAEAELLALLQQQRDVSASFVELTELRFGQGLGAGQDVARQRLQLLALQGQIDLAEGRRRSLRAQLDALLGRQDGALPEPTTTAALLDELEPLDLGAPADLLSLRPDLSAAERRLAANDLRLVAAVREWLPSLSLSASLFDFRTSLSDLFEDLLWQVVGRVSQSVYQGGARAARVDQARAAAEERLYAYGQALLTAVQEVRSAAASAAAQADFLVSLEQQLGESGRALDLSREGYRQGATDYLNVLTALASRQSLEQQQIEARRQQLSNRVQLCRALGQPIAADPELFETHWSRVAPEEESSTADVGRTNP